MEVLPRIITFVLLAVVLVNSDLVFQGGLIDNLNNLTIVNTKISDSFIGWTFCNKINISNCFYYSSTPASSPPFVENQYTFQMLSSNSDFYLPKPDDPTRFIYTSTSYCYEDKNSTVT
jgi:hypothetical protein